MIKTTVPYQILIYKTFELVVESELISSSDYYDLTSILKNNPVMAEKITHSRAREQPQSRVSLQNVDVDVDEEEE
jgi:hypothetical protein